MKIGHVKRLTGLVLSLSGIAATSALADQDAYNKISNTQLGHAYLYQLQGEHFKSMAMLMVADKQQRLGTDRDLGQLLLAGNFTQLGLQNEAIKIYGQLATETKTSRAIRDIAWLEKAKLHLEQQQPEATLNALANIKGSLNNQQEADQHAAQARALLATGETKQALAALDEINEDSTWALYQIFNIGVELIDQHRNKNGALILHKIGQLEPNSDEEIEAIKDQANLALGYSLLKLNKAQKARSYLEKVRLKSHLADIALLGMGWSYSIEGNHEQALVFWMELQNRPYSSAYSYETMLAVPYALGKADAYKQALQHYQTAQQQVTDDMRDMNEAKKKINSDLFRQLINATPEQETGWITDWQKRPESPANRFLPLLLDNPEFQSTVMEYRALLQLETHLESLKNEIKKLEALRHTDKTEATIAKLHLRQQQLTQQLNSATNQQLVKLKKQALSTFDRYQSQLNAYEEQIRFGIAQAIESGTFKAEEEL